MKYIRNYNSFRKSQSVNEEFIGKAFKNLIGKIKKKASIALSKKIGSAKEIDKLIENYKEAYMKNATEKMEAKKKIVEFEKQIASGGEENEDKRKELKSNFEDLKDALEDQKKVLKEKFNQQFKDILKEENDDRVKSYIKLKKLEMAQEIAARELKMIQDLNVTPEDRKKNPELDELIKSDEEKIENLNKKIDETTKSIESGSEDSPSFPFEDATKSPEGFKWDDSPYANEDFKQGEKITYWSGKHFKEGHENAEGKGEDYKGTTAYIGSDDKQKEQEKGNVYVTLNEDEPENGFSISKKAIVTTAKAQESKAEQEEKEAKEAEKDDSAEL